MKHEPCMSLADLAREKGVSGNTISQRAKKIPYPAPVVFEKDVYGLGRISGKRKVTRYHRSALLAWWEQTSVRATRGEKCTSKD